MKTISVILAVLAVLAGFSVSSAYAEQELIRNQQIRSDQTRSYGSSETASAGVVGRLMSSGYDKSYKLAVGDRIQVVVYPEDEYIKGGMTIVGQDGRIFIDGAGKVDVAGKTIQEAEDEAVKLLQEYFVSPDAVIDLLDSQQRSVVVLGQVKKPGTYYFPTGKMRLTLMEAISLAGGFSEIANIKKIRVARKTESGSSERLQANAESILGGSQEDVELQPDDIVHVDESMF